ncbi:MAG TPA: hypothetical protein DDX98_08625 [Bacteroidales bacterium]|jgi:cell division protein FtsN|nr:hypothetical protein [Bacteroidales bacterium]
MRILNLMMLCVIVLSLSSCKKLFKKDKLVDKSVDTVLTQSPKVIKEQAKDTTEIVTIVEETEPVKPSAPGVGYTSDRYYMVVGSFLSEKLAMKYAKTILDMGYSPQVIYSESQGYYRVSAQSYDNYTTAINDISSFRGSVTSRAWVHVKK